MLVAFLAKSEERGVDLRGYTLDSKSLQFVLQPSRADLSVSSDIPSGELWTQTGNRRWIV